jgi:hypothetical protein
MAYFMSKTLGVYPPNFMELVIGEPQRAQPDSQSVSAFSNVLRDDAVGGRIDFRKWLAVGRHPDPAFPDCDIAAGPGNANLDGGRYFVRGGVHARHATVALIESPDRAEPGGIGILETTLLVAGSIRESTPAASEGIQMLPAPAVIPPSVFATPDGIAATIFCDFASTRSTDPSLQMGTQTLPNAMANPEQGVFATVITEPTLLVAESSWEILFFGLFEIQTLSPMATQSGDPGIENFAMACSSDIGCWTDFNSGPSACVAATAAMVNKKRSRSIFIRVPDAQRGKLNLGDTASLKP